MRMSSILTAAAAIVALGALGAHAGPLGGAGGGLGGSLGGGLGGQIGGPVGGLGGQLGATGSLGGRLDASPDLSPAERAAAAARARARKAKADAKRAARAAVPAATAGVNTTAVNLGASVSVAPSRVVVETPVVGLPPVQARLVRERQSAALFEGGVAVLSEPEAVIYMDRQAGELRRELAGSGVRVTREGETIVLEMPSDVTFAFDHYDIRPRFYSALNAVAHTLNGYPATLVDVIGHTDSIGSASYNQVLSERRAGTVATYIRQREEIPARMYVAGRGKFEPIASNATIEGRAANRRVEILLHPYLR